MSDEAVDGLDFSRLADGVDHALLAGKLMAADVPDEAAHSAAECVVRADGVLLYGSWARGQARPSSDLDLLILNGSSHLVPGMPLKVSIAQYTTEQLREADRTLFGMHLTRDGRILHDTDRLLRTLLDEITPPDPVELLARIHRMTAVLHVTDDDRREHIQGLCKVARYLLRSGIYATALRSGRPSFSLDDLSEVMSDPTLPVVLSSHEAVHPPASSEVLHDLIERLRAIFGSLPENPFETLDALIVGRWDEDRDLASLATLAIAGDEELPYEELPKVIL